MVNYSTCWLALVGPVLPRKERSERALRWTTICVQLAEGTGEGTDAVPGSQLRCRKEPSSLARDSEVIRVMWKRGLFLNLRGR